MTVMLTAMSSRSEWCTHGSCCNHQVIAAPEAFFTSCVIVAAAGGHPGS
jgi:hypothetical protein